MEKFSLFKKWFWVGIAMSILGGPVAGLVFGLALLVEPEYRKEGMIISVWAITLLILGTLVVLGLAGKL